MYVPLFKGKDKTPIITDWGKEVSQELTERAYFIDDYSCISIDIIDKNSGDKGLEWKKQGLTVSQKTQHIYIQAFKDILDILYQEDDVFYLRDGNLHLYQLDEKNIVRVTNAGDDNVFEIRPSVIVIDEEEYEGATLFINSTSNYASLVIDELKAISRLLEKIDIFLYSQSLINMYLIYKDKINVEKVTTRKEYKKKSLFVPDDGLPLAKGEESVISTMRPKDVSDPFEGLGQ